MSHFRCHVFEEQRITQLFLDKGELLHILEWGILRICSVPWKTKNLFETTKNVNNESSIFTACISNLYLHLRAAGVRSKPPHSLVKKGKFSLTNKRNVFLKTYKAIFLHYKVFIRGQRQHHIHFGFLNFSKLAAWRESRGDEIEWLNVLIFLCIHCQK